MIYHGSWRILLAFLIAPVATPLVFFLFVFLNPIGSSTGGFVVFNDFAALLLLVLLYAYGAEVLFGIPVWLLFNRYRITSYWAYLLAGAGIGVIVFASVTAGSTPTTSDLLFFGLPCVVAAATSALTFRIIASRIIPHGVPPGYNADSSP